MFHNLSFFVDCFYRFAISHTCIGIQLEQPRYKGTGLRPYRPTTSDRSGSQENDPYAPTPVANKAGADQKSSLKRIIRMGRKRTFAPLRADDTNPIPDCRRVVAYSVRRMAVLAEQTDKHYQSGLHIDIVFQSNEPSKKLSHKPAGNGYNNGQR